MPELPDVELYLHALRPRVVGETLERVRVRSPSLLRTVDPPLVTAEGRSVIGLRRIGKRIVFELEQDLFLVLHLMIAGRLQWRDRGAGIPGRLGMAALDFPAATLLLTEASSHKRSSLHLVRGDVALVAHDPGGIEPLTADLDRFRAALTRENHTLKRSLTDPRFFSGIGNAYSDEILHRARLSPFMQSQKLDEEALQRLHAATVEVLREWRDRLQAQAGDRWPKKVTAFRPEMAVHGKFGQPCPVCGSPVQRIVYSSNETNYCAPCQTDGRVLADRSLSRLLKEDWPRTLEELEERFGPP